MGEDFEEVFPPIPHVEVVYEHKPEKDRIEVVHEEGKECVKLPVYDFKKGDWVIIKDNFDEIRFHDDPGITTKMLLKKGEVSQIRGTTDRLCFLVGDGWSWAKEWLEPYDINKEVNIDESDIIAVLE